MYGVIGWCLCALWATVFVPAATAQTLDDAYQVELTRLTAEKTALSTSLDESNLQRKRARSVLVKEIESLAATLTRLRAENNSQELQLPQTARLQSLQEQERNVDRRARQIETWLETHGVSLPASVASDTEKDGGHQHPALDVMMKAALDHVEEHGQLWLRTDQEYFDADGVATQGSVLRIAEVGAVVIAPKYRPLSLASDGSLRLSSDFAQPSVSHGDSRTVGVVLFDPDDIRPARTEASTWRDWMDQGGIIMWVIGALAVLALLLFLERIFAYALYLNRVSAAERRGPSVAVSSEDRLLTAVAVIQMGQGSPEDLETEAAEAITQTQPYVRRGVSLLAVVASVAPLLGLLGTVTGMIGTFGMITEHGTGDPRLLSGGISQALLTTQFGLMVAIPALLFQTTLYRCGDALLRRIERFALSALHSRVTNENEADGSSEKMVAVRSA